MRGMTTIADFIAANGLEMSVDGADSNPHVLSDDAWSRDASHYLCTITRGNRSMDVPFSMGSAHTEPPTLEMVLDAIASDAASVENAPDWIDWADEMGFDFDDAASAKQARTSHEATVAQTRALRDLLDHDGFEALVWNTERI